MSYSLKSFQMIMANAIRKFTSKSGVTDFRPGSVISILLETMSTSDFEQYYQMLQIIRAFNLETSEGTDLENRALEITGKGKLPPEKSTGFTRVSDNTFTKKTTTLYSGLAGPVSGQTYIYVSDAGTFPATGSIIVGRGTSNVENANYTSIDNLTNFYKINLSSGLLNDHGTDENIILSQGGDRTIFAGTVVKVPQSDQSFEISFVTDIDSVLLDGEDLLEDISVTAVEAGVEGNVAASSIITFDSSPFVGATVSNPSSFTNGTSEETDPQMRDRIQTYIQTLSRGTRLSIKNAAIGIIDTEQNKRVVSANFIDTTNLEDTPLLYIDDGTGFEPTYSGKGNEAIIDGATGGEQFLQLEQFPLVKAQVETLNEESFGIINGDTLIIGIGAEEEILTFSNGDFSIPQAGTAEEVAIAINDRMTLIEARTSQIGRRVIIRGRRQTDEDIRVVGGTANSSTKLNFPIDEVTTLLLYKETSEGLQILSKDGRTAILENNAPNFPIDITVDYNFKYIVDNTVSIQVDLRPTGLGGDYSGTYGFNTDVTLGEMVEAINKTCPGIAAYLTSNNTRITLISNIEKSVNSKIQIQTPASNDVNNKLNFSLVEQVGANSDYTLNRFNGQIELEHTLQVGNIITAGSTNTRGFIISPIVGPYNLESGGLDDITFSVDSGGAQTVIWLPIDFSNILVATAQEVIDVLNRDLSGITASVTSDGRVKIRSNSWDDSVGSIEVTGASGNGNSMGFDIGIAKLSISPHTSFLTSGNAEDYIFEEDDQLIVVLDNDPQNKTFSITMDLDCEISIGDSVAPYDTFNGIVSSSGQDLGVKFVTNEDLKNMRVIFKSGNNFEASKVITGGVLSTTQFRVDSDVTTKFPNNGDLVTYTTKIKYTSGLNEGEERVVSSYAAISGDIVVTSAFSNIPSIDDELEVRIEDYITSYNAGTNVIQTSLGWPNQISPTDTFILIPKTAENVATFMNNTTVTTFSVQGRAEAVESGTKVQIESNTIGNLGVVNVTGGDANDKLGFSTISLVGKDGYQYFTGLLRKVQRTIDGLESNTTEFPGTKAGGIQIEVAAPTVRNVSVVLELALSNLTIGAISNEVKSKITNYINNLRIGEDVILSKISEQVLKISGVTDVYISSPRNNIPIADNEVGRIYGDSIILG